MAGDDSDYDDRGSGAPLVLLHPFPFTRLIWAGLADELAAHRRVITVDARGFGGAPLDGRYALTDLADDLAALLDRLNIARATLLGMSMGGYTALAFAARHPKRLSALILADTRAAADSAETRAARAAAIELIRRAGPAAYLDVQPAAPAVARRAPRAGRSPARARRDARRQPDRGHRGAARPPRPIGRAGGDRLPRAGRVRRRRPGDAAAEMQQIAAAIPGARFASVAEAGHIAHVEAPGAFSRALAPFLSELSDCDGRPVR